MDTLYWIEKVADSDLKLVTIMNYPREPRFQRMCYIFLDTAIAHGAKNITILYDEHPPVIAPEHARSADIEVRKGIKRDLGHSHFNLFFKLANLAELDFPFLFLDADMAVLDDLHYLWSRRNAKPWIGIDHQWVPSDPGTHRSPFLNSGLQLVSDPAFYDLEAILKVQNAAAPLHRSSEFTKFQMFACPGNDQALLFRYFRAIGYDYTHPEIGPGWNSCAGVTEIRSEQGIWKARSKDLQENYEVQIVHYWAQFKPWKIDCPLYASYAWVDERLKHLE